MPLPVAPLKTTTSFVRTASIISCSEAHAGSRSRAAILDALRSTRGIHAGRARGAFNEALGVLVSASGNFCCCGT